MCVGEVLGYCDPAIALREFRRVLTSTGTLICDFGSSRSFRNLFRSSYGSAADITADYYNETLERTWVYDPEYLLSLLTSFDFKIAETSGTHTWSALARRLGLRQSTATGIQRRLEWLRPPAAWADIMTIVAVKT